MKKRVLSLFMVLVLCLTLLPTAAFAEGEDVSISGGVIGRGETGTGGGGIYVPPGGPTEGGGGTYIPGEDTRTEIWCVSKPDSIGRSYDGTTDGGRIPINLTFTDGKNEIEFKEGTDFSAVKTFDSADAGWHTVTVEITLIGEAAAKYKLKAGEEKFEIGGNINKAYPDLTVSLSRATCAVGEKLLPLLSLSGVKEDAAVTYYYTPYKMLIGDSEHEGRGIPAIDENTVIDKLDEEGNNTYYVYARTAATKNYNEGISDIVELTVSNDVASVTTSGGVTNNYTSLDDALNAAQDGDTVTLLSDVDLGETYVTISKSITFDLNGKTLSSSGEWLSYGVLMVKNATVTVKNGTVKAAGDDSCAIQAYRSGAIMTLEDVTATVTSGKSSVTVGDFGSAVIKSGDYQGLYVGKNSHVTLEGGTFRPYMDTITNKNDKSIFWKVNETTDATSRDCMELLGDGCVYVDENRTQVRTGGGFNTVVTVQQGTAIDAPVAKIGDVKYASLSKAINAVQNGGTITLLDDLDLGNGAVLQVGSPKKNFTIDLDSHTLSADGACLIMLHNGSQLTLKNGTLDGSRCTSYQGVLYISSNSGPKLTLENVTAKSGSVAGSLNGQRSVLLAYVAYGTVVFDGGTYTGGVLLITDGNAVLKSGTFQKGTNDYSIKTEDSGKHLSDYLDDDSQFWNDNTPLDLSNKTQTADEVTVRPCKHNWENGKCTVCQKVCDHGSADGKFMTEDPCPTCGMKAAAQVDITGSDAKYFLTFSDALVYATQNNGCTLKLLANVTDPVSINTPFIFDLNGHNFNKLSVGARAKIRDSSTTKGTIRELKVFNMTDETVLTVADLLEEGYAFKSSSGNKWYFGVENAITNVTVQPAPIKSVTAEHPTVTVEYGKTSGVTLTATAVLATEGGTVSYQWYKIGGTDFPIQDATENTYQLPADLGAGTHTYRLTATSDGYPKSVDITVKVTPISLKGATVTVKDLTYNGQKQFPTVTVKLGETTLTKNTDFDVNATMQTNAGSYKLTISGNGNYSGEIKDVEWKIEPMKIDSVMVSTAAVISKVYDGTAKINMTAEEWAGILEFRPSSASATVAVPIGAYTISDACFLEDRDNQWVDSPEAGKKSAIAYTVTFNNSNYVLQNDSDKEPAASKEYMQSGGANFTIRQANVTSPGEITQLVFNDLAKTYEIDLNQVLDKILPEGGKYGDIQYQGCDYHFTDSTYLDSNNGMSVSKEGILTLPTVSAHTSDVNTQIGTITVPVVTTNYQKFEFTIKVVISARIPLNASGVTVSASEITYGQTLNESKLTATGTMKHPGTGEEVKGTFAWKNGTVKPDASDSYEAEWTFTPAAGYEEYAPASGTVTVKVKPAKLQDVSVLVPDTYYYTGDAQRVAVRTSGLGADDDTALTFTYSKTENGEYTSEVPEFTEAGTYTVYYKAEAANHVTANGTFSVQIKSLPISLISVEKISKTYDGTASVTLSTEMLTFFSKAARRSDIKLPILALSFSNARFTMKQADGSYVDSPEVGGGKALSFTMTLESDNYVFEREPEGTKTVKEDISTDDATKFTITKADAPTNIPSGTLNVVNGTEQSYTYDFKQLLPGLDGSKTYGAASCTLKLPFTLANGYATSGEAELDGSVLTLPIKAPNIKQTGNIGTITVTVVTDNYEDFNLTLNLNAVNKIKLTPGKITCSDITYGDPLSKSTISGTMYAEGDAAKTPVSGTFAWVDANAVPTNGSEVYFTFAPDDTNHYEDYVGTVSIKVNPKSIEGATVTITNPTYDGYAWPYPAGVEVKLDGKTLKYQVDYTYPTINPPAMNAGGSHTLTIQGIGCYTGEITRTWTIEPRDVPNPGLEVADGVYNGGNPVEPTVTLTDDRGKTIDPKEYTVTFENNINVGAATVTVTDKDGGNYVLGTVSTTFEINKAESTATAPTANNLTYNGTEQALVTAGKANGGTMVYSLSETGDYLNQIPTGKDAGSYTVYYKVVGDDNHNDTTVDSVSVTIQKAKVTVTAENKSSRVGQSLKELSFTCVPALFDGDAFTGALACEADKDKTGSYEITQGSLALNGNYAVTFVKGTYTVEAKLQQSGFKFGANTKTVTYGDVDFPFVATGAAEGSTVTYSSQNENVAVVDDDGTVHILMAGETTITAMASETMDYVKGMAEYTLKVDPKTLHSTDLEQTGGAITKVYDGTTKAEGITVGVKEASLVGTDTLSITGSAVYNSANVDKATEIIFTPDAITEGNYRLAAAETLTISGASITQATPVYTAPTGLTAKYGQTLADVALPSGWSWEDGSTPVGDASATAKTFKATFTPDDPVNYQTVSGIDIELLVSKAEGRNLYTTEQSQKYTDNQEHHFEPNWAGLPEGQNWIFGSTYRRGEGSSMEISRLENNRDGSKLIYALDGGKAGEMVDLILTANCGNYETFTITLRVTLTDRDEQAALSVTGADTVVYGQTLTLGTEGGSGTGAVTYAVTNGTGEAAIETDTGVLTPVKVGTVTVTATKAGDSEYSNVVSAPFTVTITKAASTGEPGYARITTSGKTLADAELTLTGSTLMPTTGTLEWVDDKGNVLPDDTKVEANKRYIWRFTPADGNYMTLTGEVELYHVSSGGSGSTTAPVITVPVSSDKETVKVDASVSNGVATVKVTDRQLEQVTTDTDTVTVDVSGLKNVDSAKLPSSIVEKAEQSGTELTIALPTGTVTLDAAALAAVGNGKDVTISMQKAALTDTQRDAVGTLAQVAAVVDVNVLTGTAKRSNFNGGKLTVSIPYTLKSGEDPAKLQVWFIRDDGSIENKGGSYDRKTGCFVFSTEHLSRYLLVSTASAQRFVDVPVSAYYADAVAWAVKNGITGGTSAATFAPDGFCTRAQAVTFLWRAAGSPAPKSAAMPFADVPAGSYYYDAVLWAIENDITKGTSDTTFSPNANCSRGQIVTFLWRSQMSPDAAAANPFTDVVADAYYTSAVLWAVERNITGGTSATTFSPSANCTRAQIVTFIYRCMK